MQKIKKGDEVVVISGKDRKRKGTVIAVLNDGQKLLVEGINTVKKTVKANPNANEQGGISIKSMPINSSNVMLYNASTDKATRVGIKVLEDGRKVRFYKDNDEVVDVIV